MTFHPWVSPRADFGRVRMCDRCRYRAANPALVSDADPSLLFCTLRCQTLAHARPEHRGEAPEAIEVLAEREVRLTEPELRGR